MDFLREAFRGGRVAGALNPEPLLQQFMDVIHLVPRRRDQPAPQHAAAAAAAETAYAAAPPGTAAAPREPVAPPASDAAIRQLPTIRVAPEDLMDTANRECSICLEEHHLDEKVLRLPCAHIFHRDCIVDWLQNCHCTCPTCRYELETDHPMFELGRRQRMLQRKLRFAQWELERMSIRELRHIWQNLQTQTRTTTTASSSSQQRTFVEKSDLLHAILSSPRVDIIHTPEPVSYHMRDLQAMSISNLKHTMQEAGVFFDPKDVVEKQDMYQIFKNSGRLILLQDIDEEEDEDEQGEGVESCDEEAALFPSGHVNPTAATANVVNDHEMDRGDDVRPDSAPVHQPQQQSRPFLVETVDSDGEDNHNHSTTTEGRSYSSVSQSSGFVFMEPIHYTPPSTQQPQERRRQENPSTTNTDSPDPGNEPTAPEAGTEQPQQQAVSEVSIEHDHGEDNENECGIGMDYEIVSEDSPRAISAAHEVGQFDDAEEDEDFDDHMVSSQNNNNDSVPTDTMAPSYPCSNKSSHPTDDHPNSPNGEDVSITFSLEDRSIAELQLLANFMNINVDRCLEKADMIDSLRRGPALRDAVKPWSVSILNAMARLINMDVSSLMFTNSGPTSQERLVVAILQQAHQQPHVAPYMNALMPMAKLNASQLRAVARERGINLSGCPEVGDMFYHLAKSTASSGGSTNGR